MAYSFPVGKLLFSWKQVDVGIAGNNSKEIDVRFNVV
jgi:hypothetical protein